jgi:tetratricopeptide (TPR) repeat protein
MSSNIKQTSTNQSGAIKPALTAYSQSASTSSRWQYLPAFIMGLIWFLVIGGAPRYLPLQPASALTFIALLIAPGYFLADMITWRLTVDWFERLALALPFGLTILALPGTIALLRHMTLSQLIASWIIFSALVIVAWFIYVWYKPVSSRPSRERPPAWRMDERLLLLFVIVTFILSWPALSRYKIDGDAYAVSSFAADALANLPLNASEPLFGTSLGPGVRAVFNQSLPMMYLWSALADIDPVTLTAVASRNIIALWIVLATYTLGKAAFNSRRFGLYATAIQMLIYLAAPFWRGDNVSLFFFERNNADKFMVLATMLPVVCAFAIQYVRFGRRDYWLAAAVATLAVSLIHPLIAAMLALSLASFGGFHLLFNLRHRLAWRRVVALAGLVILTMFIPLVQLLLSRGEAPLASAYPGTFDGWKIGERMTPILPFVQIPALHVYGPLPDLDQLEAGAANSTTNPFLIWRFAINMDRQRLIFFDIDRYVTDPRLILEPIYILALLMLPLLLLYIHRSIAAQFILGTTVGILVILFSPFIMPLIGSLVMPWILWRLIWLFPYGLIIAAASHRLVFGVLMAVHSLRRLFNHSLPPRPRPLYQNYVLVGLIFIVAIIVSPRIQKNIRNLSHSTAFVFPAPQQLLERLDQLTTARPGLVLADQDLSVTIPAYAAQAHILAHRIPNTSEIFPADKQDIALQRLIDQHTFFINSTLTTESINILLRYQVGYVVVKSGSELDRQMRLASYWFEWELDDDSYTLYTVRQTPRQTAAIQGNSAMSQGLWAAAGQFYETALAADASDRLAQMGLIESALAQGQFDTALAQMEQLVAQNDWPNLHYRLGQLYAETGDIGRSHAEFNIAQQTAPEVSRFHAALGDACLQMRQTDCAGEQYKLAAAHENFSEESDRLIAAADLWRRQGRIDQALPLYQEAVTLNPNIFNQLVLEHAYREAGQADEAAAILASLRTENPWSADILTANASILAAQNRPDEAIPLYQEAIQLQTMLAQETMANRLALAQFLLQDNLLQGAEQEIDDLLGQQPYYPAVYRLEGELYQRQGQGDKALSAYQIAFTLDPTQIANVATLTTQMQQNGRPSDELVAVLTTAVTNNPDEPTLYLTFGDHWQRQGNTQAALDAYHIALTHLDPYNLEWPLQSQGILETRAVIYARLARLYEDQGQIATAMHYYQAAVAAAPHLGWTQVLLGDAWRRRNEPDTASAAYRQAIEDDATYINAYVQLAELLYTQGKPEEAEAVYSQGLEIALTQADTSASIHSNQSDLPDQPSEEPAFSDELAENGAYTTAVPANAPTLLNSADERVNTVRVFARLHQVHNQTEEAIALYQAQIEQGEAAGWTPTIIAQYYKGMGDLYLADLDYPAAVEAYEAAIQRDGWWAEAHLGLAEALTGQGDLMAARHSLETAVSIAPGSAEAQVALAAALEQAGNSDQALAIYQTTAQAHPGDVRATLALARAWQARNAPAEAQQAFQQTVSLNPNTADAYVGLAELALDVNQLDEAEAYLQQAIAADQQNINAYFRLAELEQRRGHSDEAQRWYQHAATLPLNDTVVNITLIDALMQYGNTATALGHIEAGLARRPNYSELLLRLGRVQQQQGQFEEAEKSLRRVVDLKEGNGRYLAELAEFYLGRGRLEEALNLYQRSLALEPEESAYYLAINRIQQALGQFDAAAAVLRAGLTQVPDTATLYSALVDLYLQQGQPDLALATLQEGLAADDSLALQLVLGVYYESQADFAEAEQLYSNLQAAWPEAATPIIALSQLRLRQNDYDSAISYYQQAIALAPNEPGYYLSLANTYVLADRLDEAEAAYKQALALAPTLENGYVSLGSLYEEQGRWGEMRTVYEQGLAISPQSPLLSIQVGRFHQSQATYVEALAWLDRAVISSPTAATMIARAPVYSAMGYDDAAERDLLTAVQIEPGSLDALIALADWYRDRSDWTQAEQYYQQALILRPGVPTSYLRLGALANTRGDRTAAEQYEAAAEAAAPGDFVR